jgi:hypothetical protein
MPELTKIGEFMKPEWVQVKNPKLNSIKYSFLKNFFCFFLHSSSSLFLHTLNLVSPQLSYITKAEMLKLTEIGSSTL